MNNPIKEYLFVGRNGDWYEIKTDEGIEDAWKEFTRIAKLRNLNINDYAV
jgi:hypothetical protein